MIVERIERIELQSFVETQDRLTTVRRTQERLRTQLNLLALSVDKLSLMLTPQF